MKKKIYFLIGLVAAGIFAYYAGYHEYTSNYPQTELLNPMTLQKSVSLSENKKNISDDAQKYYFVKISQETMALFIRFF